MNYKKLLFICLLAAASAFAKPIPVILDTDIGDDIDDTWALGLLLKSSEVDVKLVVGDFGNPQYRAKLLAKFLQVAGRTDIPVGLGIESKSGGKDSQAEWVKDYDLKSYPGKVHQDGVQAMIDIIMQSPEPITLICIGPVPNIAAALEREPRIAQKAKFVGMHGSVRVGYGGSKKISAEWNVKADAKSCQRAFTAPWEMTITPLDTCGIVKLEGDRYQRVRDSKDPIAAAIIENYRIWAKTRAKKPDDAEKFSSTLYDAVAVYLAFHQDHCKMERLGIRVTDTGFTEIDEKAKPVNVATEWKNLDAFRDLLVERLTGRKPNVVLIISDDHCWTDYGFMGHKQLATPHLDKLAAGGLTFRRGYVPSSLCCPSLAAIITGLYPHQNKVTCNDPPGRMPGKQTPEQQAAFQQGREVMNRHLEAVPTLPRMLTERGYLTLQTGKWWQGDFRRGGFTHGMTKGQRHGDEGLDIGRKTMQPIYDFIATARKENKPWFVWYAPMMPHDPHTPPQRLLDKYKDKAPNLATAKYWAMVEWFDETCGQLLDHLDKENLAANTIVLYVTDNGWITGPNGRPVRSKLTPYDAGLRTPIMVRWPGKVKPRMSDDLAMSIDLVPTVLAALGSKPTPAMQGVNLLDDAAVAARKTIYGECFVHTAVDLNVPSKNLSQRWIIDGHQKLIVPHGKGEPELYDLAADPMEERDLAAQKPKVVEALTQKLDAWWKP